MSGLLSRRARGELSCRCGAPASTDWMLVLRAPKADRTVSAPLCASCGPVLFDQLADAGWLSQPTVGQMLAQAKKEHEKALRTVWVQEWEESERGWGTRPDGYSCHRHLEHIDLFVRDHHAQEVASTTGGYGVPDVYSRPVWKPFQCEIDVDLVPEAKAYGRWLPEGWKPKPVVQPK